jgi:membrane protein DedA with SNARE-associated domain
VSEILSSGILVFLTGLLGIWKAVPVGFAFGLPPYWIWFLTTSGASVAAIIIYYFGSKIRQYIERKRKKPFKEGAQRRIYKLLDKYGTPGLGFLGTLLMGPNMTMLFGITLVPSPLKLLIWTLAGISFWTLVLVLAAHYSVDLLF